MRTVIQITPFSGSGVRGQVWAEGMGLPAQQWSGPGKVPSAATRARDERWPQGARSSPQRLTSEHRLDTLTTVAERAHRAAQSSGMNLQDPPTNPCRDAARGEGNPDDCAGGDTHSELAFNRSGYGSVERRSGSAICDRKLFGFSCLKGARRANLVTVGNQHSGQRRGPVRSFSFRRDVQGEGRGRMRHSQRFVLSHASISTEPASKAFGRRSQGSVASRIAILTGA